MTLDTTPLGVAVCIYKDTRKSNSTTNTKVVEVLCCMKLYNIFSCHSTMLVPCIVGSWLFFYRCTAHNKVIAKEHCPSSL